MGFLSAFLFLNAPAVLLVAEKSKETQTQAGFSPWGMWIIIIVMLVVFYFLLIRPQRKRAQEHEEMISKLKKGDEVITIGGIHGTIKKLGEDFVILEVDKGVRVKFSRSAISKRLTAEEEEEEEGPEEELEEPEEAEDSSSEGEDQRE